MTDTAEQAAIRELLDQIASATTGGWSVLILRDPADGTLTATGPIADQDLAAVATATQADVNNPETCMEGVEVHTVSLDRHYTHRHLTPEIIARGLADATGEDYTLLSAWLPVGSAGVIRRDLNVLGRHLEATITPSRENPGQYRWHVTDLDTFRTAAPTARLVPSLTAAKAAVRAWEADQDNTETIRRALG